jgi:hypothetical protein
MKQVKEWYVTNNNLLLDATRDRDRWCIQTFGDFRNDIEVDEGWWLQSEEEYVLFVMRWGV